MLEADFNSEAPVLAPLTLDALMDSQADTEQADSADDAAPASIGQAGSDQPSAGPSPFAALGLADELVAATREMGFDQLTAVQAQAIPLAMARVEGDDLARRAHDLMVSSQTGSGKTAAFLLPMLDAVLQDNAARARAEIETWERQRQEAAARGEAPPKRARRKNPFNPRHYQPARPAALVLCPTRELAQQVAQEAIRLVAFCKGVRIASVVGGLPYGTQIARLQNANLVVATPGRLLDLVQSRQIELDGVRTLTIDEADRMLDLGFADDLAAIHQHAAKREQTLMFSATFAPRVQQLAMAVMRPDRAAVKRLQVDAPQQVHALITQALFWADDATHRRALLDHWLRESSIEQAIVFASTQVECEALAEDLQQSGFAAVALHGALPQGLRNRRLGALRMGQVKFLVATDVAARGIDVPTISHVFNYGLPMKPEDYTHRIGRTGRAGREGLAITLAEPRDQRRINAIEAYTQQRMKVETIPGLEPRRRAPEARPARAGRGPGGGFGRSDRGGPFRGANERGGNWGGGNGAGRNDRSRPFEPRQGDARGFERPGAAVDNRRDDRPQAFDRADRPNPIRSARTDTRFEHRHAGAPAARGFSRPAAARPAGGAARKPRR